LSISSRVAASVACAWAQNEASNSKPGNNTLRFIERSIEVDSALSQSCGFQDGFRRLAAGWFKPEARRTREEGDSGGSAAPFPPLPLMGNSLVPRRCPR